MILDITIRALMECRTYGAVIAPACHLARAQRAHDLMLEYERMVIPWHGVTHRK